MNYPLTDELLDLVNIVAPNAGIKITCTNEDWRGREYQSDLVTLDSANNIGFEVLENEIIIFYFTEHHHFEDYSFERDLSLPNYVERAKEFLKDLFSCTIRYEKKYKGKTLISERYVFVYSDKTEECPAGVWVHGILVRLIPFLPKRTECITWKYDKKLGTFVKQN